MKHSSQEMESIIFTVSISRQMKCTCDHINVNIWARICDDNLIEPPHTSKQAYRAELQSFLGKQHAWLFGWCATDHSSRTALHAFQRSWTFQSHCLQVPEPNICWLVDRQRWTSCLASTLTWFNFFLWGHLKSLVYSSRVDDVDTF
jgi:hypothetical protein